MVDALLARQLHGAALLHELGLLLAAGVAIYGLRVGWRLKLYSAAYRMGVELRTRLYRRLSLQGPRSGPAGGVAQGRGCRGGCNNDAGRTAARQDGDSRVASRGFGGLARLDGLPEPLAQTGLLAQGVGSPSSRLCTTRP